MSIRIDNDETKPVYESPTREKEDHEESDEGAGLKPTLKLFDGVMVIVGCIIGSGIFISPKGVHEHTLSVGLSLVIWVICGAFSAIGAYCYAELGTFIRESGGDYAYVLRAFGPLLGFIRLWIECIIVRPCTITTVAITFATYILQPFYPHCDLPPYAPQLLAAGVIVLLCQINCINVKFVSWIQNIFTVTKLLALALIILTGLWLLYVGDPYWDSFENAFEVPPIGAGSLALALYSGLWAYNGWNYLNFITEEMINPTRDLPRAIFISCTICTVVYVLVNAAFYAGTSPDELLESKAIAVTFANKFYGKFAFIMPILVAGSCFGTVNGVMLTSSRLFFVAGRNNHMPSVLSYINPYWNTPIPAVLFTAFLSLLYMFLSDNIYTLINYVQIVNWVAIGIATVGLLWLRYKQPPSEYPRPLQVHLAFPIIFLIGCAFLVIFPVIQAPMDTAIGIGIMLTGLPVYFLFINLKGKLRIVDHIMDDVTLFSQKLMLVVPEKKDT
ncbi:amino acid permease domain-containing protein [Ditylenchus destructor]|uniref:Amino acid permease domain-containing protein n=1 Tax=Ditylenchus destructor TaxID=166010 RepID=A0AAD4NB31_9BILA|nr:amino acid permease domain-containing protein [Ditylenchus destructor]